jgi:hypothetical protein
MDRMVPEPRTFKELVEADLRRAARLIIKVQDEIDPQFRIATPEGDCHLAVTLPRDPRERMMMLRRVSAFMAWKKALGFVLASELHVPDCVYALGVMGEEVVACLARITRTPKPWTAANFGKVEWMDRSLIGQEMIDLLPRSALGDAGRAMSKTETAMLESGSGQTASVRLSISRRVRFGACDGSARGRREGDDVSSRAPDARILAALGDGVRGMPWRGVVDSGATGDGRTINSSLPKYVELWPRVQRTGAEWEGWKTVALSVFNNIAASCGGFLLGVFSRWLWFG